MVRHDLLHRRSLHRVRGFRRAGFKRFATENARLLKGEGLRGQRANRTLQPLRGPGEAHLAHHGIGLHEHARAPRRRTYARPATMPYLWADTTPETSNGLLREGPGAAPSPASGAGPTSGRASDGSGPTTRRSPSHRGGLVTWTRLLPRGGCPMLAPFDNSPPGRNVGDAPYLQPRNRRKLPQ